ncbi:hypothetical protein MA5S0422_4783 [Mycobacteroides abscessus 5S-0422]|uniref:Uncharacterized protein n=1 Tax=Mycobacteroides abscessus subsp. bolletii 1513 TaxID=1299321 RepID=X8DG29_9MYCO|nr:hypothetical protein [Mycobacteroides abscessus]EUA66430.1 hypothetical protein I540_4941 [Mycobacteroides abscessus subsp. bolletii 1513]EIU03988.1 hypothetical protein MA5S0422_4783 [Mycobacteroides abscessus 5S-0422]EIU06626.1 hypothetical protein MA5S0421_3864 [Mycobacteroides abscessus 5S-0421]EIU08604.1 hypothetical protein MA5S0304_3610 [Mycobacteroides abscessus 5S-0304]EIU21653.1 hypothetical protein MA5S0708_3536 [Mycobacteroides abscessus 5S-0708]
MAGWGETDSAQTGLRAYLQSWAKRMDRSCGRIENVSTVQMTPGAVPATTLVAPCAESGT